MNLYKRKQRWYVDFYIDGKRYRKVAGATKGEARSNLQKILRKIEDENREVRLSNTKRTFAEFSREYLSNANAEKAKTTFEKDCNRMKHLVRVFGDRKLRSITVRDIERYKEARRAVVKPASVNRELNLLSHMFRKAIDWEYYSNANPVKKVKKCKEPPGRVRYLSSDEREQLLTECKRSLNPFLYEIVMVGLETGMRLSEQKSLCWQQIDLSRRTIRLKETKNNQPRTIPINDRLLPILERLYVERRSQYVFFKPYDSSKSYGSWERSFRTALEKTGIKDFSWHSLRHSFASNLVMAGVDIRTVQVLMGHKSIAVTMRYAHLSQPHLLDAVNKLVQNDEVEQLKMNRV